MGQKVRRNTHRCYLPIESDVGFSKLSPHSSLWSKLKRKVEKLIAMNPNLRLSKEIFLTNTRRALEIRNHTRGPYFYIIHPFSNLSIFINSLFVFSWLYGNVMTIILANEHTFFDFVNDLYVLSLQWAIIIVFFFSGYVDFNTHRIVLDHKKIVLRYLKTYFFFDLLATMILFYISDLIIEATTGSIDWKYYTLIKPVLRTFGYLTRLPSVFNCIRYVLEQNFKIQKKIVLMLVIIIKTFIYVNIFANLTYIIPTTVYRGEWPDESWCVQAKIEPSRYPSFQLMYSECFMMAVSYFFGATRAKYIVSMPNEQITLSCVMVFGRLYTLFQLAEVLRMWGITGVSASNYENYMQQLHNYMMSKDLPIDMRNRLVKFCDYKLQGAYFNEPEILSTLSEPLRREVFLFGARNLIRNAVVMHSIPRKILGNLILNMESMTFCANDVVFRAGDNQECIYFISSGTIAVHNKDGLELCHLIDGEEFGINSMTLTTMQYYTMIVVEQSELYYIKKSVFLNFIQNHPSVFRYYEKRVKERVALYRHAEDALKRGGEDMLSSLQEGRILERLTYRIT